MTDWLVDTNILVYAYDRVEHDKRIRSRELLDVLVEQQIGSLSAQVLGEFYNTVTRKIRSTLTADEASSMVLGFSRSWVIHSITAATVIEATLGARRHQLSYWDALVWATAKVNGTANILSEDFTHGRLIEGVRVLNPFQLDFDWREAIGT